MALASQSLSSPFVFTVSSEEKATESVQSAHQHLPVRPSLLRASFNAKVVESLGRAFDSSFFKSLFFVSIFSSVIFRVWTIAVASANLFLLGDENRKLPHSSVPPCEVRAGNFETFRVLRMPSVPLPDELLIKKKKLSYKPPLSSSVPF